MVSTVVWDGIALVILLVQIPAIAIVLSRLLQGPTRRSPLRPQPPQGRLLGAVSVLVPTLNEADRIAPCLAGLTRQGYELREAIVVDSNSQDGTREQVQAISAQDPRFRLLSDDPLPKGWVGRPWALHTGFLHSSERADWILGIDADTQPQPGLINSLVQAAEAAEYDLVSLSPQFILQSAGEFWLQPALLMTLVYRFGPSGGEATGAERVMANGQCFLIRRSLLAKLGGYASARQSFCDDVTLARVAAAAGAKVGFWDGANLLKVRMYANMAETWREWGRSLDLKDAATPSQVWGDAGLLALVQAAPWLLLPLSLILTVGLGLDSVPLRLLAGTNAALLISRVALLFAIAPSYDHHQPGAWAFWLSPTADMGAVVRIWLSSFHRPTTWRGRQYS